MGKSVEEKRGCRVRGMNLPHKSYTICNYKSQYMYRIIHSIYTHQALRDLPTHRHKPYTVYKTQHTFMHTHTPPICTYQALHYLFTLCALPRCGCACDDEPGGPGAVQQVHVQEVRLCVCVCVCMCVCVYVCV